MTLLVDRRIVKGKSVYIFESHNMALVPWAECRRKTGPAPRLFTLDYHTDTHSAFIGEALRQVGAFGPPPNEWMPIAQRLVDSVRFDDAESVSKAAHLLRYDEQIDAAIRTGIIDIAFVAAHSDQGHIESNEQLALDAEWRASEPFTQSVEDGEIVVRVKATSPRLQ